MAKTDDLDRLPLPKSRPKLAKRAFVLVNSMLKVSFDMELGRRLDCASRRAREHAKHERLRLDSDSGREVLRLISARPLQGGAVGRRQWCMPQEHVPLWACRSDSCPRPSAGHRRSRTRVARHSVGHRRSRTQAARHHTRGWRNRYTRMAQNHVGAIPWRFDSSPAHQRAKSWGIG